MNNDLPGTIGPRLDELDLAYLLRQVGEAIVYVDRDFVVRYCNEVYLQSLGLEAQQVIGRTPFEYLANFRRSVFFEAINECRMRGKAHALINYSVITSRWIFLRALPCDGGALLLVNEASEDMLEQFHLAQKATKDPLTGIANKVLLVSELKARLASGSAFSLAVIKLSRFETVNDVIGLAGGDRVLVEMASRLQLATVDGEILCRLSGNEFALLSARTGADFEARVDALMAQTRRTVVVDGHAFTLGSVAGLIDADPQAGAEAVIKRAGLALRQCRREGSGSRLWYEDAMEDASREKAATEDELRRAIREGAFVLELQPKGGLPDRAAVGAEALIRWPHPERGLVSPMQFLPIAQECGLMVEIDRWVISAAIRHIATLKARGVAVPVSINLSVQSLSDPALVDTIEQTLRAGQVEPALLEIEIPEGAVMHDVQTSSRVLSSLEALGVAISIDDFGTGYSSFAYLARFPVKTLKIDRSFVDQMGRSASGRKIVRGLIHLAHSLSMRVVAEGVETEQQASQLQSLRCDEIQGYGYGRPMSVERFCEFVEQHRPRARPNAFSI